MSLKSSKKKFPILKNPNKSFIPITEQQLSEIESFYGFKLPEQYRDFILNYREESLFPKNFNFPKEKNRKITIDGFTTISYTFFKKEGYCSNFNHVTYKNNEINKILIAYDQYGGLDSICIGVRGDYKGKIYNYDSYLDKYDENGAYLLSENAFTFLSEDFNTFLSTYSIEGDYIFELLLINNKTNKIISMIEDDEFENLDVDEEEKIVLSIEYKNLRLFKFLITNFNGDYSITSIISSLILLEDEDFSIKAFNFMFKQLELEYSNFKYILGFMGYTSLLPQLINNKKFNLIITFFLKGLDFNAIDKDGNNIFWYCSDKINKYDLEISNNLSLKSNINSSYDEQKVNLLISYRKNLVDFFDFISQIKDEKKNSQKKKMKEYISARNK